MLYSGDRALEKASTSFPSVTFCKPPNLCQLIVDSSQCPHNPATPTGSRPCCKTCPIHPPASSFYPPHLPHNYPCRLKVYEPYLPAPMQCMQCFLHYRHPRSLSDRINRHHFTTTVSDPDLLVAIRTQSTRFHFKIAGLLASYTSYLIPLATLKLRTNLFSNHVTLHA